MSDIYTNGDDHNSHDDDDNDADNITIFTRIAGDLTTLTPH
jgi:hypothetical protein